MLKSNAAYLIVVLVVWPLIMGMEFERCRVERESENVANMMVRYLAGDCSKEDREALAVASNDVLNALKAGKGVDLDGVVLKGDLMFDVLSLKPLTFQDPLVPFVRKRLASEDIQEVRVIKGPLKFRRVEVQGIIATNLIDQGYLLIQGPVMMNGTIFQRSVDFSRTAFLDKVDFSGATIGYEGFFIQALFAKDVYFKKTAFGTHSRFHKATFLGKAIFTRSGFNGLAEFLEVTFKKEADFLRAKFLQGTGFSGSQFKKIADFSETVFKREVYFRFTKFEDDTSFRRSIFRDTADFTKAKFSGITDYSHVLFEEEPILVGVVFPSKENPFKGLWGPLYQAGMIVLVYLFVIYTWVIFRNRE